MGVFDFVKRRYGKVKKKMIHYIKRYFGSDIMFKLNRDKVIDSINRKWNTKTCPMCGKNNWTIDDKIVTAIKIDEDKNVQLGGKFNPLVAITCLNCGNVIFINPLVIGAVDTVEENE